jgi:hypothetical protein
VLSLPAGVAGPFSFFFLRKKDRKKEENKERKNVGACTARTTRTTRKLTTPVMTNL